jgi:hypothetical protein
MTVAPDRSDRRQRRIRRLAARAALVTIPLLFGWLLARLGLPTAGAAIVGGVALTAAFALGLFVIRGLLSGTSGIAGVAGAVIDEAVRMRSTVVLLMLLLGIVPILPLLVDPAERLTYRLQFLLGWSLGGAGLILGLLTAFLACGSVCGDIESGRIHMTLAKPLRRWEYLLGKWLGIVLYALLLVGLAGAGSYTLVRMLALGPAVDGADRQAVEGQVLVARRSLAPRPDRPEEYAAAIAKAIATLEADSPDGLGPHPEVVRRRIRQEYDRQWHTVTPDMETTFLFSGVGPGSEGEAAVQLQVEPRATNVDVDLADVRFAIWLNGRPWPVENGVHQEITLPGRARHVFDLPADLAAASDDLRVRIANRNLVPPGETRPTAITFPPGDGMRMFVRAGSFEANLLRCLVVMWAKVALVAAVGVAAGAMFDLPSAILVTLIFFFTALGGEFLAGSLGAYNIAAETGWERAAGRIAYAAEALRESRWYDSFRMLLGFVSDGILGMLPSFTADGAVAKLATGILIPTGAVVSRLVLFAGCYPALVGVIGWLVFDRRDLVRTST